MALMVNGQSASASEILAASFQDYNRALIVGSNTYGKATMQQMMVLDTVTNRPTQIATCKRYRESHEWKIVSPFRRNRTDKWRKPGYCFT